MAKFLRIASWNANGILNHIDEVNIFLKQNLIDILLISETHFTEKSYLKIPNYNLYHTNHPDNTAHAGTAILIKSTISHYELPKYEKDHLQATSINVKTMPYDLTISAVYCPPRHNLKKEDYQRFFQTLGSKFLAGGDYNSKHTMWGSRITTTKGKELSYLLSEKKYSFLSTGTPTYWPSDPKKQPDLLDFFVINGISSSYTDIIPSYDLSSDHTPIIATISTSVIKITKPLKLCSSKTNWDSYKKEITNNLNLNISLKTPDEIEEATGNLISTLQEAAKRATPNLDAQSQVINIPLEIKKLISEKRKARAKWQRTHNPNDKTIYNRLGNTLKQKLRQTRDENYSKYITNLNRHDHSIWKPIKSSKKPVTASSPIRIETPNGTTWARSNNEKADLFARHLAEVFTPHNDTMDSNNKDNQNTNSTTPEQITDIPPTSPKEIKENISFLNNKKAPGIDMITARMLKELPRKGVVMLTYIFNAILRLQYWPEVLKTSEIILIPKPGKALTDVTSYRPISLLSVISKLLEKLILQRINPILEVIPEYQFGFRQNHSTIQQGHRIVHVINDAVEEKKYCSAVFLDVSQAFDKVWHDGLLHKVRNSIPTPYYLLIKSYLSDRYFRTRVNDKTSGYHLTKSGVPQGSVLGPILYLIYTSDLPTSDHTTIGTFADDTVILATHEDPEMASANLQDHLFQLEDWLKRWRVQINQSKSQHVTFTLRKAQCPPVLINEIEIPQTTNAKYLGLYLDSRLNWKAHITKKRKQIDLKMRDLYWLLGRNSQLCLENKILIYKTVIIPIWTYGIELWGCASKSNISVIQRAQSKILRAMVDAPWYVSNHMLHQDLRIPTVQEVIKERSQKHHQKIKTHTNSCLKPLTQENNCRRLKRKWPEDLKK